MRKNCFCRVFIALVVAWFFLPQVVLAVQYDIFLLGGQSNMDGRGIAADHEIESNPKANFLNASNFATYNPVQTNVDIFYNNSDTSNSNITLKNAWIDLGPRFSDSTNLNTSKFYFGPEVSFGKKMAEAMPGHNVLLIKYAAGGTNLREDWNPRVRVNADSTVTPVGTQYTRFLSTVSAGLAALTARGDTYVIRGMAWHQGESDNMTQAGGTEQTTQAVYEAQLKNFITSVREDMSVANLPFIIGQVGTYGQPYSTYSRTNIRAAQLDTANTFPNTGFASADGLRLWDSTTHFDANGQITMGERLASSMVAEMVAVPEPGSLMVLGAGGLLLLGRTRRCR